MEPLHIQAAKQRPTSMQIFKYFSSLGIFAISAVLIASGSVSAFDGTIVEPGSLNSLGSISNGETGYSNKKKYKNADDALRQGILEYQAGEKLKATNALEYAADEGSVTANWKLGKMYADGDGVGIDDYKAYKYFIKVADKNSDISPYSRMAPAVAKAFVALGTYYRDGIKNTSIKPNLKLAHEFYHYAAAYFADSDGQYHLGRLYLDGMNGERDSRRAAQWLNLSAEKGHIYAMAILGNLLVNGDALVPAQIPKGLMWLDMAKEKANPKYDKWVIVLGENALLNANEEHKALAERFKKQFNNQVSNQVAGQSFITGQSFEQKK